MIGIKTEIIKKHTYAEKVILFSKEEAILSFKQAKALIGEMISMIESNEPCANIMRKNTDAVSLLRYGQQMILQDNLGNCFKKSVATKSSAKNKKIREEMIKTIKMFYK